MLSNYQSLSKNEGEIELIFNDKFIDPNLNTLINDKIIFEVEILYDELQQLNKNESLEIELILNNDIIIFEPDLINIHNSSTDTNNLSLFEVELLINNNLVLSQSEATQLSIKNDWNLYEKITYNNYINLKNNKWSSTSILFSILETDNLIEYLQSFYIDKAYILDNDKYYSLFDENYYNLYKKNIGDLKNLNYIGKNVNTNDSCFIKKNAPKISAVIVGINYKNTDYSLTGAINDANNMEEFLLSHYGDQIEIVKMTDDTTDKLPTKNIESELLKLISKPDNNIIFYFAGHIYKKYNIDYIEESDFSNERIKTLDENYISDDWFYNNFIKKLSKNVQCRIYIDSCFSQGFCDFKYKYTSSNNININPNVNFVESSVISINSSNENVKSLEENGQGIFTKELIDSFKKIGNYNIIELFDRFYSTNIMSTFKFDREPILLL